MAPGLPIAFFSGAPGPGELVLVFLVVLLLFGPRKLPGVARSIGQILQQLRRASDDFKDQLMSVDEEVRAEMHDVVDTAMTPDWETDEDELHIDPAYSETEPADSEPTDTEPTDTEADGDEVDSSAPVLSDAEEGEENARVG